MYGSLGGIYGIYPESLAVPDERAVYALTTKGKPVPPNQFVA